MTENQVTSAIISASIDIHRKLGPGLLESAYESLLVHELLKRDLKVVRQAYVPLIYEGIIIKDSFRADLIVEDLVIVEIKCSDGVAEVHFKQLLTYLRVTGLRVGLLINFNEVTLKQGIKRVANDYVESDRDQDALRLKETSAPLREIQPSASRTIEGKVEPLQ